MRRKTLTLPVGEGVSPTATSPSSLGVNNGSAVTGAIVRSPLRPGKLL
jgi:hypothetical protein